MKYLLSLQISEYETWHSCLFFFLISVPMSGLRRKEKCNEAVGKITCSSGSTNMTKEQRRKQIHNILFYMGK